MEQGHHTYGFPWRHGLPVTVLRFGGVELQCCVDFLDVPGSVWLSLCVIAVHEWMCLRCFASTTSGSSLMQSWLTAHALLLSQRLSHGVLEQVALCPCSPYLTPPCLSGHWRSHSTGVMFLAVLTAIASGHINDSHLPSYVQLGKLALLCCCLELVPYLVSTSVPMSGVEKRSTQKIYLLLGLCIVSTDFPAIFSCAILPANYSWCIVPRCCFQASQSAARAVLLHLCVLPPCHLSQPLQGGSAWICKFDYSHAFLTSPWQCHHLSGLPGSPIGLAMKLFYDDCLFPSVHPCKQPFCPTPFLKMIFGGVNLTMNSLPRGKDRNILDGSGLIIHRHNPQHSIHQLIVYWSRKG